jgi:hypothetical protein
MANTTQSTRDRASLATQTRLELGAIAAVIITNFAVLYFDFPSFAPFLPDANISLGGIGAGARSRLSIVGT